MNRFSPTRPAQPITSSLNGKSTAFSGDFDFSRFLSCLPNPYDSSYERQWLLTPAYFGFVQQLSNLLTDETNDYGGPLTLDDFNPMRLRYVSDQDQIQALLLPLQKLSSAIFAAS
jgi:hypothetical protein